jgi:hypothetical protein
MDSFTAIPGIRRLPITIIDKEKYDEWLNSPDLDAPVPTKVQVFVCYEKGPGTPVPVQIEIDKIDTEYSLNIPTEASTEGISWQERADMWRKVNMSLRRNLLLAVVRGLDVDDANVLATSDENNGEGYKILCVLGWLTPREEPTQEEEQESVAEHEEEGEDVTGELTSSISPVSIKESTSRRTK